MFCLNKLKSALRNNNRLVHLSQHFLKDYNLIAKFGVEIEFYLNDGCNVNQLSRDIGSEIISEKGSNQYEINIEPSTDLTNYANVIFDVMSSIKYHTDNKVDFTAKPYENDYGSSMHYHFNFTCKNGNSIDLNLDYIASILCHYALETYLVFMPSKDDYLRTDHRFMAPTHLAWGGNNRSVLIRIPDSLPKRIEHRAPSPLSDPYLVMTTIMQSLCYGFANKDKVAIRPKTYGLAFDPNYNLTKLPSTYEQAVTLFNPDFFIIKL